jgi:hypothetical protein
MGNLMNKFIKKLFGIDKIEAGVAEATKQKIEAEAEAEKAREDARIAKLSPKDHATEKGDPWVGVLDTKVNPENPRNGFFELDWNEPFVVQLRLAGYKGDTEEAVVDLWFQDLCRNVGQETGVDMDRRGSGYINVNKLSDGKTEIY